MTHARQAKRNSDGRPLIVFWYIFNAIQGGSRHNRQMSGYKSLRGGKLIGNRHPFPTDDCFGDGIWDMGMKNEWDRGYGIWIMGYGIPDIGKKWTKNVFITKNVSKLMTSLSHNQKLSSLYII